MPKSTEFGKRTALKGWLRRSIQALDVELNAVGGINKNSLKINYDTFLEREKKFLQCQLNIEAALDNEEDLQAEMDNVSPFLDELKQIKIRVDEVFNPMLEDDSSSTTSTSSSLSRKSSRRSPGVKLPPIVIQPFSGNYMEWQTFREQFYSTVDASESIPVIHKFQYLHSFLRGEAKSIIFGLPITIDNYPKALSLLDERYNDKTQLITSHLKDLFSLKCNSDMSVSNLKSIYDNVILHIRALETLSTDGIDYGVIIFKLLVQSKFPRDLLINYTCVNDFKNKPESDNLDLFIAYVQNQINIRSSVDAVNDFSNHKSAHGKNHKLDKDKSFSKLPTANFHVKAEKYTPNCVFCHEAHNPDQCLKVKDLSLKNRKALVFKFKRCLRCLKYSNHVAKDCRIKTLCVHCNKPHHSLLCDSLTSVSSAKFSSPSDSNEILLNNVVPHTPNQASLDNDSKCSVDKSSQSLSVSNSSVSNDLKSSILLMTASALISGAVAEKKTRLLLDGGSQRSYIRKDLADELGCQCVGKEKLQISTFGEKSGTVSDLPIMEVVIKSLHQNTENTIDLISTEKLCSALELIPNGPWIQELQNYGIELADGVQKYDCEKEKIDIIIGADHIWKFLTGRIHRTQSGYIACESSLGWILHGKRDSKKRSDTETFSYFTQSIPQLWDLDTIGITSENTEKEDTTLKVFKESTHRDENGRYEVSLAWRPNKSIQSNYDNAYKRYVNTKKHLKSNLELNEEYDKVFEAYLKDGIIEPVKNDGEMAEVLYYLPHHPVFKPSSSTTKIRPVFDGSSKNEEGYSLNDILDPGPSLLPLLFDVLLRFRYSNIVLISDITKAFLQIAVKECDRDALRFFWKEQIFRFKRVCFGISCSPFLLNAVIRLHLSFYDSAVANEMSENFYVDDLMLQADSINDGFAKV